MFSRKDIEEILIKPLMPIDTIEELKNMRYSELT